MIAESPETTERAGSPLAKVDVSEFRVFPGGTAYECRVVLIAEDGGFCAHALRLPGVASQGDTEEDAIRNIAEAFAGAARAYLDSDEPIPWCDTSIDRPKGSMERWIIVDVK